MTWIDTSNVSTFHGLVKIANDMADGWMTIAIVIVVFFITFFPLLYRTTMSKALAAASILAAVVSIGFYAIDALNPLVMYLTIIMTIGSLVAMRAGTSE